MSLSNASLDFFETLWEQLKEEERELFNLSPLTMLDMVEDGMSVQEALKSIREHLAEYKKGVDYTMQKDE